MLLLYWHIAAMLFLIGFAIILVMSYEYEDFRKPSLLLSLMALLIVVSIFYPLIIVIFVIEFLLVLVTKVLE